jgi:hypothetical protein
MGPDRVQEMGPGKVQEMGPGWVQAACLGKGVIERVRSPCVGQWQVEVKTAEVPAHGEGDGDGHGGVTAMLMCLYHTALIHAAHIHQHIV